MLYLGFNSRWVDIIMMCFSIVRYFAVLNSDEFDPIVPKKGLRQGDLPSSYLFILY